MNTNDSRIVLALDGLEFSDCMDLAWRELRGSVYAFKIHDLWDRMGSESAKRLGFYPTPQGGNHNRIWVDLKLKDIPNTVALRARAVRVAGAQILTVHASGGIEMMQAAVENGPPEIYAVSILTSLDEDETHLMYGMPVKAAVLYFARLAKLAGVHGVVCSPLEAAFLKKHRGLDGLKLITPGIRPMSQDAGDQKRVDTPASAIKGGADLLVIGRPITEAGDPIATAKAINEEIGLALKERGNAQ